MCLASLSTVWYNYLFEPGSVHTLVPVQLVKCRSASLVDKLDHVDVIPCIDFLNNFFVVFCSTEYCSCQLTYML